MSLSRSLPPADPDPALVALFTQSDRIPKSVRRQAEFFLVALFTQSDRIPKSVRRQAEFFLFFAQERFRLNQVTTDQEDQRTVADGARFLCNCPKPPHDRLRPHRKPVHGCHRGHGDLLFRVARS